MRVGFVIVSFNGGEDLANCVISLLKVSKKYNRKVIVVDNDSKDRSVEKIKKSNKVILILNNKNLGYAGAINKGIQKAVSLDCDYLVFLNQDTFFKNDFLTEIILGMESDRRVGVGSGLIVFTKNGKRLYDGGGKFNHFLGRGNHFHLSNKPSWKKMEVDYMAGCLMVLKREVVEKVGLFDEDYFLGYEDVDYCMKVKNKGYKRCVFSKSEIYHKGSTSLKLLSGDWIYYWTRNRLLFIKKNYCVTQLVVNMIGIISYSLYFSFMVFVKSPRRTRDLFGGYWDFLSLKAGERC